MTGHRRAAGYFRVSTVAQAHTDRWSLPTQRAKFTEYCAAHQWIAAGEYTDVESGRKDSRKEYQRLLADARAGLVDAVVVQWLDRFGRNYRETLARLWELEKLGVKVVATDEEIEHALVQMIRAWQASEESARTSQRVRAVLDGVVQAGRWPGRPPYGYILVRDPSSPERGKLQVDELHPERAELVRRIFALYAAGARGFAAIAGQLNREGVPSPLGGVWWGAQVQNILMTAAYNGRPMFRGVAIPGGCPAIVDDALWQQAQAVLTTRAVAWHRQPATSPFLLVGLVRCACGTTRHCHTTGGPSRGGRTPIRYYRCAHQTKAGTCELRDVRADRLERAVLEIIAGWRFTPPLDSDTATPATEREHERRRAVLRETIATLGYRRAVNFDSFADRAIPRDLFTANERRYAGEIAAAERELTQLRAAPAPRPPSGVGALLARLDLWLPAAASKPDIGRRLIRELVARVEIVGVKEPPRVIPHPDVLAALGLRIVH